MVWGVFSFILGLKNLGGQPQKDKDSKGLKPQDPGWGPVETVQSPHDVVWICQVLLLVQPGLRAHCDLLGGGGSSGGCGAWGE